MVTSSDPLAQLVEPGMAQLQDVVRLDAAPPIEPESLKDFAVKVIFGYVWNRPGLSTRDRRLVTLGVLAAMDATRELAYHVHGGLASGDLTEEELREVVVHVAPYAGYPRASTLDAIIDAAASGTGEAS